MSKNNILKAYNDEIYAKTKKYQKIYGFEIGTGEHDTWNNEADAFKHTFMQADLALKSYIPTSQLFGNIHELQGDMHNQPKGEKNMDLWNNDVGRRIAKEIKQKYNRVEIIQLINSGKMDDMIASKVMSKMRKGELITHPSDPRKYKTFSQKFDDELRAKYNQLNHNSREKLNHIFKSTKSKAINSAKSAGKWVTINGRHVFLD